MPYIPKEDRTLIDKALADLCVENAGELNYALTKVCQQFLQDIEDANGSVRYSDFNDVIGALESCKLEFYRRRVADYEKKKINENGDVF